MRRRTHTLIGTLVVSLVIGLVAGVGAVSAADPPEDSPSLHQSFVSRVARILGLEEDKVKDAFTGAQQEMVDEAVEEGRLTEEQPDQLKELVGEGALLFWGKGKRGMRGWHFGFRGYGGILDTAADLLGLEREELLSELQEGKSLAEIAAENNISRQNLIDTLVQDATEKIGERGATQVEAFPDRIEQMVDATGIGSCGPGLPMGGFRGSWGSN